jgi:uroporphyrinogen-III decarboxylase
MDQWYNWHLAHDTLPDEYKGRSAYEIIRELGGGIHPHRYYTPGAPIPRVPRSQARGLYKEEIKGVEVKVTREGDKFTTYYSTPKGDVRLVELFSPESEGGSSIEIENPFKSEKDYPALEYIYQNTEVTPDHEPFYQLERALGDDGVPITPIGDAPVHQLMRVIMGYDRFFYEMADNPTKLEGLLRAMEEVGMKRARIVADSPAITVQIAGNWVDVIHRPIFERYMIPWCQKVNEVLHAKGKLSQAHVDGEMRQIVPLFLETGIDTAEAIAPHPMTSVTIKEFREAWGDKVTIWGGLPSTIFQPMYSDQEFDDFVLGLLRDIEPGYNFILGMGDNVPYTGAFHRVRRVVELLDEHGTLPISI